MSNVRHRTEACETRLTTLSPLPQSPRSNSSRLSGWPLSSVHQPPENPSNWQPSGDARIDLIAEQSLKVRVRLSAVGR